MNERHSMPASAVGEEQYTPIQVSYYLLSCERKEIVWRSCGDPGDFRRPQVNGVLIRASMRYVACDQPKKATAAAMRSACAAVKREQGRSRSTMATAIC
jgi:hypothetical protein